MNKNFRLTMQKKEILNFLRNTKSHPTPEMVYSEVRLKIPMISFATVYRILKQMVSRGLVNQVNTKGGMRFDGDVSMHQHFICDNCGEILDVFLPEMNDFAKKVSKSRKFRVESVNLIINGRCKKC